MKSVVTLIVILASAIAACGATPSPHSVSPETAPPPEATIHVPRGYRAAVLRTSLNVRVLEYDESTLDELLKDTGIDILAHFNTEAPRDYIPLGDWLVDVVTLAVRDDLGPDDESARLSGDPSTVLAFAEQTLSDDGKPRLASNSDIEKRLLASGLTLAGSAESPAADTLLPWLARLSALTDPVETASPLQMLLQGGAEFALLNAEERASFAMTQYRTADRVTLVELPARRILRLAVRKTSLNGARLIGRLREESAHISDSSYIPAR